MPRSSYTKVELEAGEEPAPLAVPQSDTPFRMLLMGDFSGRASRGVCDPTLRGRRPLAVDRDNFDQVLEKLAVELASIRFRELDDFHPDRLFDELPVFRSLRETRLRLENRATFQAAAAEMQSWRAPRAPAPRAAAPPPEMARLTPDEILANMLNEAGPAEAPAERRPDEFDLLLREIVAPHIEPKPDPQQAELVAELDETIGGQMRSILHHPEFQALEAAWRGLFFLVRRLETDTGLKLYILDVSRAELAAALGASGEVRESALYDLVVEQSVGTPGAEPWAVLAGDFTFSHTPEDLVLLRELGRIARAAGAPFLAAASPRVLGCASLSGTPDPREWQPDPLGEKLWHALRCVPEAGRLGLAIPRFLLRLPYGRATDSTERFDFEEMPGLPGHEEYLWGNPVFACLALLGRGFSEYGWEFRPDAFHDIEGLPAHLYKEDGESTLKPCAEGLITERTAEAILEKGLMLFASMKGSDRIKLVRFQNLADPPGALAGRWG